MVTFSDLLCILCTYFIFLRFTSNLILIRLKVVNYTKLTNIIIKHPNNIKIVVIKIHPNLQFSSSENINYYTNYKYNNLLYIT